LNITGLSNLLHKLITHQNYF